MERALDAVPPEVRETVVVLGYEANATSAAIAGRRGVRTLVNADYLAGIGGSISGGVKALAKDTQGVMILLTDQPFVSRALLGRLLGAFERGGATGIVAVAQGDLVTPPAIFSRKYFGELERLRGDEGARSVIQRHKADVTLVKVRSRRTLEDVDTWEEFQEARRLLER